MNFLNVEAFTTMVNGVRVLGKQLGPVTIEEIDSIECDLTTEAHLIRHFSSLPNEYCNELLGAEFMLYDFQIGKSIPAKFDKRKIEELLRTGGSKFDQEVKGFSSPREVYRTAMNCCIHSIGESVFWLDKGDRQVAYIVINFSHQIGTRNVLMKDEIKPELRRSVFTRFRGTQGDKAEIRVVLAKPPETNILVIMLRKSGNEARLETAYPGVIVPDLPQPAKHSKEELTFCRKAWADLVFVEEA